MSESMRDKAGTEFDPAIHYVKDGKGVLTKGGLWRRRPGVSGQAGPDIAALIARLDRQQKEIEQLRSERTLAPDMQASLLQAALAELADRRPNAGVALSRPEGQPNFVPYKGLVRAKEKCAIGSLHEAGEVFTVDMKCLWSDDPFEAVTQIDTDRDGTPVYGPNPIAPEPVDFRFRLKVDESTQRLPARAV